jgi:hypothetical protein
MLDQVVQYLRAHGVPFRLSSAPSAEPSPTVAHPPMPPGGVLVETRVLVVGGKAVIACMSPGAVPSLPQLQRVLGLVAVEGVPANLPPPFAQAAGWIPPLGGAMGVLTVVDERLASASVLVFQAFSPNDWMEVPYDDFGRLECPRVAAFATFGELPDTGTLDEELQGKAA